MLHLPTPDLKFFADLSVEVAKPIEVGQTIHGTRRLIPILGGTVNGDGWTARVLPGGADFQLIVTDQMAELDARYALETDAGDVIYVQNHAIRTAAPEVMAKLIANHERVEVDVRRATRGHRDLGGLRELLGHLLEERRQRVDRQRQHEGDVRDDQRL